MKLAPTVATLVTDGLDKLISIHDINKGDLLRVKPGEDPLTENHRWGKRDR
jgi:Cu2+-exporting ATPase